MANFDWFLKKVYQNEKTDTGKKIGSFYFGDSSNNTVDMSQDGIRGGAFGQKGDDILVGGDQDILYGDDGNDTLVGMGMGAKVIAGNLAFENGNDTVITGAGANVWARLGGGFNQVLLESKNNGEDVIESFDLLGNHGFTRVDNFDPTQDKIGTFTREYQGIESQFTTGIQLVNDSVDNYFKRGSILFVQEAGSDSASPIMRLVGDVTLTQANFGSDSTVDNLFV